MPVAGIVGESPAVGEPAVPAEAEGSHPMYARRRSSRVARWRARRGTTPGRLRLIALGFAVCLLVVGAVGWAITSDRADVSRRMRDHSAPLVTVTQRIASSLAEADAAATSAFLSGAEEDKDQRRQYEDTVVRVSSLLEQAAGLLGDHSDAHRSLADIQANVVQYTGLVEAARAQHRLGSADAQQTLSMSAAFLAEQLVPQLEGLAATAAADFDDDYRMATASRTAIALLLVAVILGVVAVSWHVAHLSRRVLNVGLVIAGLLLVTAFGWTAAALSRQHDDLRQAKTDGRGAVDLLASVRTSAYRLESELNRDLIAGAPPRENAELRSLLAVRSVTLADAKAARSGTSTLDGLLGDVARTPRSDTGRALVAEMLIRWQRFDGLTDQIVAVEDAAERSRLASTAGAATFTGFNVAVDSLLAFDEDRFLGDTSAAVDRLAWLPTAILAALVLAALAGLYGLQQRINEYR